MKNVMFLSMVICALFFVSNIGLCATNYVKPNGVSYGLENGTDWSNAYDGLPATLTRGDTYVIAGGAYGGYDFNDAVSGTDAITVRKASAALDSGVDGWSSTYESTQAVFSSDSTNVIDFSTGYYTFNGVTGYGDGSVEAHGIKVTYSSPSVDHTMILVEGDNITLSHIQITNAGVSYDVNQTGINDTDQDYIHVHYCLVEDTSYGMQIGGPGTNNIYEYNYFSGGWGSSRYHQDYIWIGGLTEKKIFRYNVFDNVLRFAYTGLFVQMGSAATYPKWYGNDIEIYGNIFKGIAGSGDGMFTTSNSEYPVATSGWKIYNNTFVDGAVKVRFYGNASGHEFRNNIIFNCWAWRSLTGVTASHNYYSSSNTDNPILETGEFISTESASGLFNNYTGGDYTLVITSDAVDSGINLDIKYSIDPNETSRNVDGWDIGAYEAKAVSILSSPQNFEEMQVQQ